MPLENKAGAEQPQRANAAYAISEDEISLRDLWEIITKRKWLGALKNEVQHRWSNGIGGDEWARGTVS